MSFNIDYISLLKKKKKPKLFFGILNYFSSLSYVPQWSLMMMMVVVIGVLMVLL